MSVYNGLDGQVLSVKQEFLDDNDQPLVPKAGYPVVKLIDSDKDLVASAVCSPSVTPGNWSASLAVPNMGLQDRTSFSLIWRMTTSTGEKYKYTDQVTLEPKVDSRESDVVATFGDSRFNFTLPLVWSVAHGDTGTFQIYSSNKPVMDPAGSLTGPTSTVYPHMDKTSFSVPLLVPNASLFGNLLKVDVTIAGAAPNTFLYKLWAVTPQILLGVSHLEQFLNKSRIENVIPELRYTTGDLVSYLERGLYMFNLVGQTSHFNGLNMQGALFDAWLICSAYYALQAQIMAEGSLAFDFSGQGVSLNVDRTPQLDAALSRLQGDIDNRVVPLKKQLAKNGRFSGDGSIGASGIDSPTNVGVLTIMNAPTTRLPRFSQMYAGRRG